jgi:hypothetical protein
MSAFLVGKPHIDALVTLALHGPSDRGPRYPGDGWSLANRCQPDALGRLLWRENLASVRYRYAQDGCASDDDLAGYTYTYAAATRPPLTAVQGLKALACLRYQSCEHPAWEASEAHAFCQQLQAALIAGLPGYEDAAWEIAS